LEQKGSGRNVEGIRRRDQETVAVV
jgi:hypothetical protein